MKNFLRAVIVCLSIYASVAKPMEQAVDLGVELAYPPAVIGAITHICFGNGGLGARVIQSCRIASRMITLGVCAGYGAYLWTCGSAVECNADNLFYNTAAASMLATNGYMLYNTITYCRQAARD